MSDFRCHYLGSYDPRPEPDMWSDEYLTWFYWTTKHDETLALIYPPEFIEAMWNREYWQSIEAEMRKRNIAMHVASVMQ